jgi:hypothetical protein
MLVEPEPAVVRPEGQAVQACWVPPALYFPCTHGLPTKPSSAVVSAWNAQPGAVMQEDEFLFLVVAVVKQLVPGEEHEIFLAITGPTPPGQKNPFGHISQTLGVSDREK